MLTQRHLGAARAEQCPVRRNMKRPCTQSVFIAWCGHGHKTVEWVQAICDRVVKNLFTSAFVDLKLGSFGTYSIDTHECSREGAWGAKSMVIDPRNHLPQKRRPWATRTLTRRD